MKSSLFLLAFIGAATTIAAVPLIGANIAAVPLINTCTCSEIAPDTAGICVDKTDKEGICTFRPCKTSTAESTYICDADGDLLCTIKKRPAMVCDGTLSANECACLESHVPLLTLTNEEPLIVEETARAGCGEYLEKCKFKFSGNLDSFPLKNAANRPFTPFIVHKNPEIDVGLVRTGEAYLIFPGQDPMKISDFHPLGVDRDPFSESWMKTAEIGKTGRSGVAHEAANRVDHRHLVPSCVVVPFTDWQKLDRQGDVATQVHIVDGVDDFTDCVAFYAPSF